MAVTVTGTPSSAGAFTSSPTTFTNGAVVPVGTTLLTVTFGIEISTAGATNCSAVTVGGVALTKAVDVLNGTSKVYNSLWYKLNPASGTSNVVATWTSGDANEFLFLGVICFTGSDTGTAFRSTTSGSGSGTTASTTLTGTTAGDLVMDSINAPNAGLVVDASQTQQYNQSANHAGSTEAAGGDVAMSWTLTNGIWAQVIGAVQAAAADTPTVPSYIQLLSGGAMIGRRYV